MRLALITTTLLSSALAPAVFAQEGPVILDPILIYGDRAAATLDDSTSSVRVVTEGALNAPITSSISDAFRRVPGISDGDFTESGFVLRGINSEGLTPGGAGAPLASVYIDGIQQTAEAARRGPRGVFDAEQLEIYRGPQSTLSGRNALAGAVYLRTKDPEFGRSGQMRVGYGENNHRQFGLAYGNAISETLAFRLSGEWSQKDSPLNFPSYEGYPHAEDLTTDTHYSIRGKLLWTPTEATDVLLSYARSYESPSSSIVAGPNWNPASGVTFDDLRGDIYGALTPPIYPISPLPIFQDVRDTTVDNAGLEVRHDFGNGIELTAMTTLSDSRTDRRSVNQGTAPRAALDPNGFYTLGGFDQRLFSQELRLNGETDQLRWVAGVYYADEQNDARRVQFAPNGTLTSLELTTTSSEINIRNSAIFGELSYGFAPGWDVTVGGRVDHYKQDQTARVTIVDAFRGPVSDVSFASDYDDTAFIPKLGVSYEFAPGNSLSLFYREGYRPGGSGIRQSDAQVFSYDAEKARNLELAYAGDLLDGRLQLGANLFYQDWDNQQVEIWQTAGNPASSYIVNAGQSTSYGAELEARYAASDLLDLYGGVALLKTKFDDFTLGAVSFSGEAFSNAPERNLVLGMRYGDETGWFTGVNINHTSATLSRIENQVVNRVKLDGYTTVDAQVGYAWDNMALTAYATNLFDERYHTYESGPGAQAAIGAAREIGITLDRRF